MQNVKGYVNDFISASELKQSQERGQSFLVIDIRRPQQYSQGHIPGAVNIPASDISSLTNRYIRLVAIVIYDENGIEAKPVLKQVRYMGYEDARMLSGGFYSWNYSIER